MKRKGLLALSLLIGCLLLFVWSVGSPYFHPTVKRTQTATPSEEKAASPQNAYEPTLKEKLSVDYSTTTGAVVGDLEKDGVTVLLPVGAFDSNTTLNVGSSGESLPPISAEDGLALCHPLEITVGDGRNTQLNKPAVVLMNVEGSKLPKDTAPDDIYMAYYNKETTHWEFFTPDNVDLMAGQITFSTEHFTDFVPVSELALFSSMDSTDDTTLDDQSDAETPPVEITNPSDFLKYRLRPDIKKIRNLTDKISPTDPVKFTKSELKHIVELYFRKQDQKTSRERNDDSYYRNLGLLLAKQGFGAKGAEKIIKKVRGIPVEESVVGSDNSHRTAHFIIHYDKDDIQADSDIKDDVWAGKNPPNEENVKINSGGVPFYIIDLGNYLEISRTKYIEAGFKDPSWNDSEQIPYPEIAVYADFGWLAQSYYSAVTGTIHIKVGETFMPSALRQRVAHELFHAVQNRYFNAPQMKLRTWWLESSADYAAYKVVWGDDPAAEGPAQISRDYIQTSITRADGEHAYATGWFLDYMVNNGADFKAMWDHAAKAEWLDFADILNPLSDYLKGSTRRDLASMYQGFVKELLFSQPSAIPELSDPPIGEKKVETVSQWLKRGVDDKGTSVSAAIVPGNYSAVVVGLTAKPLPGDSRRRLQVSLKGVPDVEYYLYQCAGNKRSGATQVGTFSGASSGIIRVNFDPVTVNLAEEDGLYILAVNSSRHSSILHITIKEADESPTASPTRVATPDVANNLGDLQQTKTVRASLEYYDDKHFYETKENRTLVIASRTMPITWSGTSFSGNRKEGTERWPEVGNITGTVSEDGNTLLSLIFHSKEKVIGFGPNDPNWLERETLLQIQKIGLNYSDTGFDLGTAKLSGSECQSHVKAESKRIEYWTKRAKNDDATAKRLNGKNSSWRVRLF